MLAKGYAILLISWSWVQGIFDDAVNANARGRFESDAQNLMSSDTSEGTVSLNWLKSFPGGRAWRPSVTSCAHALVK